MKVSLQGHATDVATLSNMDLGDITVGVSDEGPFLEAHELEVAERDPVVLTSIANRLVARVNELGTLFHESFRPVRFGGRINEIVDGAKRAYGVGVAEVRMGAVASFGLSGESPRTDAKVARTAVEADPELARALAFFTEAVADTSWDELHRAWEVIEAGAGGALRTAGWTTKNEISAFGVGANHGGGGVQGRHADPPSGSAPKKVMDFTEGVGFIRRLLRRWAEEGLPK